MTHGFQWLDEWDAREVARRRAELAWAVPVMFIAGAVIVIEIALLVLMR